MRVQFGVHACDLAACVLFLTHLVFESLRHGFSPGYAFNWEVLLDAATVPPLLLETREAPWLGGSWLSFAFLRVIRFRAAFVRLQQLGVFEARARARPSLPLLPPSENVPSLARALALTHRRRARASRGPTARALRDGQHAQPRAPRQLQQEQVVLVAP